MKTLFVEICKYIALIVIILYTILFISRSLNWQTNILKYISLREGFSPDDDDDEEEEEIEFDANDFREKAILLLDLFDEIEKTEGTIYTGFMDKKLIQDVYNVKRLWNEEEDEWKEKAYSEVSESKFEKYNKTLIGMSKYYNKIFEKAETKDSYKKKYDGIKKMYGETGITYMKRAIGIALDKEMDLGETKSGYF